MKLDLGAGTRKRDGFLAVDIRPFAGVDLLSDIGRTHWNVTPTREGLDLPPLVRREVMRGGIIEVFDRCLPDECVDEIHASHVIEHLTAEQRVLFANEAFRVLKKGKGALITVPSWKSCRAYGDYTHQWPPVTEFWPPYLNAAWRATNAPHCDALTCDFDSPGAFMLPGPAMVGRSQEALQFALTHYVEASSDMQFTLIKR